MSEDREEQLRISRQKTVENMKKISLTEFAANLPPETSKMKRERRKGNFKKILEALFLKTNSRK